MSVKSSVNEPSPIAVIETRLPYLDRRALSQAWFDALHLAREREPRVSLPVRRENDIPACSPARKTDPICEPADMTPVQSRIPLRGAARGDAEAAPELRRPGAAKMRLRTVERRVRQSEPPRVANLTLAINGARVQLSVRRESGRTRVIAVCAAQHVEQVRRALAGLDLALRVRGETSLSIVQAETTAC